MLVDVKRDSHFICNCSQEEYKAFLKKINEWKLHKIKRGFYHACLNIHLILEETIKDEYPNLNIPIKGCWFSSSVGHEYFPAETQEELKPSSQNTSDILGYMMFGGNPWMLPPFGVVDTPEQFIDRYEEGLKKDPRNLFVTFYRIAKCEAGGWRWHKWGPYLGDKTPKHEHIGDEDASIISVYCYHIREAKQRRRRKY